MVDFWEQEWNDYVNDEVPAFLLLTDAENIPWKHGNLKETMEYFSAVSCFIALHMDWIVFLFRASR